MTIQLKSFICVAVLIFSFIQLKAQFIDDWIARPGIAIEHEFGNGIETRLRYRHKLDQNMSHFSQSAVDFKIEYKLDINRWLETSIDYRYKLNSDERYHEVRYGAKLNHEIGPSLEIAYSPKLQQIISSTESPDFFIRNKLEMTYQVNEPWSVSVFSENYQSLNGGVNFDSQKNGIEAEYTIDPTSELELKMDIKNNSSHEALGRLTLTYTYIID